MDWSALWFLLLALVLKGGHYALSAFLLYRRSGRHRDSRAPYQCVQRGRQPEGAPVKKKVLVTGGCGLLGRHIVDLLLDRFGDQLSVVVLDAAAGRFSHRRQEVTYLTGDVRVSSHVEAAATSTVAVIHTAGLMQGASTDPVMMREVELDGTRHVIEACLEHDVRALVYTSSLAVHYTRLGTGLTPVREDEDLPEDHHMLTEYGACKRQGERLVRAANSHVIRTVVVRPGALLSAHDPGIARWGMLGLLAQNGAGGRRIPCCWVRDAAVAHVAAMVRVLYPDDVALAALAAQPWLPDHPFDGLLEAAQPNGGAVTPTALQPAAGKALHVVFDPASKDGVLAVEQLRALVLRLPISGRWVYALVPSVPHWLLAALVAFNEGTARRLGFAPLHDGFTKAALLWGERDGLFTTRQTASVLGISTWHPTPWKAVSNHLLREHSGGGTNAAGKKAQ